MLFIFYINSTASLGGKISDACGKRYFFSIIKVRFLLAVLTRLRFHLVFRQGTYAKAAALCCQFGLNLVSIETAAEYDCLQAVTSE